MTGRVTYDWEIEAEKAFGRIVGQKGGRALRLRVVGLIVVNDVAVEATVIMPVEAESMRSPMAWKDMMGDITGDISERSRMVDEICAARFGRPKPLVAPEAQKAFGRDIAAAQDERDEREAARVQLERAERETLFGGGPSAPYL